MQRPLHNDKLHPQTTKSPAAMPDFVAYFRVSTDKQGQSGLGLEAQTATVRKYAAGRGEIIASFQEVESGKRSDRPELLKALAMCRQKKAVLVIAKLDRLSRNVAFIANLLDSRAEFIACDMPEANKLTLHIMAAMAQHEREATSLRTREALQAAKVRGQQLGGQRTNSAALHRASAEQARQFRVDLAPTLQQMKARGLTLAEIADQLNERNIKTCKNRAWHPSTVCRLLKEVAPVELLLSAPS